MSEEKVENVETTLSRLSERLEDAGAPPLPGDLQYLLDWKPAFNDGVHVWVDIRSKDKKKLLASIERTFPRAGAMKITVRDVIRMTFDACEKLTFESKLPPDVRRLFIGAE